jgi:hypothetical protein
MKVWKDCFVRGNTSHPYSALLRSLQIAYSACKMPTDNRSSVYDYGVKVGLWISAFEILFHPGSSGNIGYKDIVMELNKYVLIDPQISDKKRLIGSDTHTNIVGLVYKDIYDKRNDFYHGNEISKNGLDIFNRKEFPPVTHIAPVIYLMALNVFLQSKGLLNHPPAQTLAESTLNYVMQKRIEEPLVKIAKVFPF